MKNAARRALWGCIVSNILLLCATGAEVTFPDPVLDAHIRAEIGKPDGPIVPEDLTALERVALYNAGVRDLAGLEHCPNLTSIGFFGNKIETIEVLAQMPQLVNVVISRNPIHDIAPLKHLTRLEHLGLQLLPLKNLDPIAGSTTIRYLDIGGVQLEDYSAVSTLTGLERITVTASKLDDLSFVAPLKNLRSLNADRNEISSLDPLGELPELEALFLDSNRITDISALGGLRKLERLEIRHNRVTSLEGFPPLPKDARVLLYDNRITDIRPLVKASGYTGDILIDLGENRLDYDAFCRDIHELEARGNHVYFRIDDRMEESEAFPDTYTVCAAAERPDAELIMASVNRGTTDEELRKRFGLDGNAEPAEIAVAAAPARGEDAQTPVPPTTAIAGTSPENGAESSAPAGDDLRVSIVTSGLDLKSLLGAVVALALVVFLVIAWRIPRSQ